MNGAIPPEHPDDDLLADLAADVLPTHQARAVEAHVMTCPRCTALLTDAEQVRNLLLTDVPGSMPPDVLARIEQALQIEVSARDGSVEYPPPSSAPIPAPGYDLPQRPRVPPVQPQVRVVSPWEDTTTIEAFEAARKRQTAAARRSSPRSEQDGASGTSGSPSGSPSGSTSGSTARSTSGSTARRTSGIGAPGNRGPRLTRPSRGPSRSRRDLREEVHDVKAGRRGVLLAGAAGVVVLLGLGGYVVTGLLGNHEANTASGSASSVEAAGKAGDAAAGPPVLTTGTNYSQATLAQQAKTLVSSVSARGGAFQGTGTATGAASGATTGTVPRAAVAGGGSVPAPTASSTAAASAADTGDQSLRSPANLSGCLAALQAGGRRVVAVDLAKYDGRDAAIIVLDGANGGYEVWAVARDCRPGADGTITYLDITP